jgi:hypothetical protein
VEQAAPAHPAGLRARVVSVELAVSLERAVRQALAASPESVEAQAEGVRPRKMAARAIRSSICFRA